MDIEGAFSHAPFDALLGAINRAGVDGLIVRWIASMLTGRTVETCVLGQTKCKEVERGCPQGGVLSPLLWDLLMGELLALYKSEAPELYKQAYADDAVNLASGIDIGVIAGQLQKGLNITQRWCKEVGLSVNPRKVEALIFTRKKKIKPVPLFLDGSQVKYSQYVQYLGTTLDGTLTWTKHCANRAAKASSIFAQCRRAIGRTWGMSPRACLWIYTGVVWPILAYAGLVWITALRSETKMRRLGKAHRSALVSATRCLRSTPTAGLEILLGILPVEIALKAEALNGMARLLRTSQWLDTRGFGNLALKWKTHVEHCYAWSKDVPEIGMPMGHLVKAFSPEIYFTVKIGTRDNWEPETDCDGVLKCFTDGSKHSGQTGAAYSVPSHEPMEELFSLGKWATVYQAETVAVLRIAEALLANAVDQQTIHIYVDNQGVLESIKGVWITDDLIMEAVNALNKLSVKNSVELYWIPAHTGYSGNERADELAKKAAEGTPISVEPFLPLSRKSVRSAIGIWARKQHESEWARRKDCRMTKQILPSISKGRGYCIKLGRNSLRVLTQIVTGHSTLNERLKRMGLVESSTCLCGTEDETRNHFLCKCDKYWDARQALLGSYQVEPAHLVNVPLPVLMEFIVRTGRFRVDLEGDKSVH